MSNFRFTGVTLCDRLRSVDDLKFKFVKITDRFGTDGAFEDFIQFYNSYMPPLNADSRDYFKEFDELDIDKKKMRLYLVGEHSEFDFDQHQTDWILQNQRNPYVESALLGTSSMQESLRSLRPKYFGLIPHREDLLQDIDLYTLSKIISVPNSYHKGGLLAPRNTVNASIASLLSVEWHSVMSGILPGSEPYISLITGGIIGISAVGLVTLPKSSKKAYADAIYFDHKMKELFPDRVKITTLKL